MQHGYVDVWFALKSQISFNLIYLADNLSVFERSQAETFRFDEERIQYVFAHGVLRDILSRYSCCSSKKLAFGKNEFGKPYLLGPKCEPALMFNMSHSKDLVLIAVTFGRSIGVDTEFVSPMPDAEAIAARHFVMEENDLIAAAHPNDKERWFYICWARKEAYVKALGKGLSIPLDSFGTAMPLDVPGRHIVSANDPSDVHLWWLSDLSTPLGYVGALVIEGGVSKINYFQWISSR